MNVYLMGYYALKVRVLLIPTKLATSLPCLLITKICAGKELEKLAHYIFVMLCLSSPTTNYYKTLNIREMYSRKD